MERPQTPRTPRQRLEAEAVERAAERTEARFASDLTARVNRAEAHSRVLEEENRRLQQRIRELSRTVSEQDEELIALRETSSQLAAQIEINRRLQEQITNSANENARLRTNHTETLNDLEAERRTIADLRQQIAGRLTRAEGANLTASNQRLSETLRQAELRATGLDQTRLGQEATINTQLQKIASLKDQLETSQLATEEALREKNQALSDLAAEKVISRGLQATIDSQNLLLSAAESNVKRLEKELTTLKSSTVDAETMRLKELELQEAKREIIGLKEQIENLKSQLAAQQLIIDELRSQVDALTLENAQLRGDLATAATTITNLTIERDQARSDLQTRTDELATIKGQVAGLTTDVSTLTTEKKAALAEVTRLTSALGDANKTSAELEAAKRKVGSLETVLSDKSTRLKEANLRIFNLGIELEELKDIIQQKDAKISELEREIAKLTLENAELRQKLQEQDVAITQLGLSLEAAKIEATEAKSAQKVAEDTLATVRRETGGALANATKKIGTLEAEIDVLNRNAAENAAAILDKKSELNRAKETERELRSRLDIAEANAIQEKNRADKLARGVKTLQEKLKNALAENARLKEDIQKLTADAVELQKTVDAITIQNEEINKKLQDALLDSQQLTNDLGVATASIASLTKKLEAEGTEKAATRLLLNEAIANKKRLESALDDQQLRVKSLESQVGTLSRQLSSKTRECGKLRDLVKEHKKMLSEQTRKRELAEVELTKSQELLRSTTVTKDALALQLDETEKKLVTANTEMASMEQKHLTEIKALDEKAKDYQTQLDELKAKHAQSIQHIRLQLVAAIDEKRGILDKLVVAQQTIADLRQESQELKTNLSDTKKALESTKTELANKAFEVEEGTRLLKESEKKRLEAEAARKLAEKATEKAEAEARQIAEENHALQQVVIDAKAVVSEKDAQLEAVKRQLVNVSGKSDTEIARLTAKQARIQNELLESRKREEESQKRLQDFERQARILRAYKIMAGIQTKRMSADTISHKSEKVESEANLITYGYDTHVANRERFSESIERAQNNQESIRYLLKIRKSNPGLYLKLKRNFDIKNSLLMSIGGTELEHYHHEITHEARDNMQNKLKR